MNRATNNRSAADASLPLPAQMMRQSYTCLTRTPGINGINTSSNTHGAANACSDSVPAGCSRTAGYRWHRKRRWIRVGNVFESGSSSARTSNPPTTSSFTATKSPCTNVGKSYCINSSCGSVRQPTFVVPCSCVKPFSCVLCTRLHFKRPLENNTSSHSTSADFPSIYKTPKKKACLDAGPQAPSPAKTYNCPARPNFNFSEGRISGLCKNAWFPKLSNSCRTSLSTRATKEPLVSRVATNDASFHPVISHITGKDI